MDLHVPQQPQPDDLLLLRRWPTSKATIGELFFPKGAGIFHHETYILEDVMRMHCAHCGDAVWLNTVVCAGSTNGHAWVNEKKVPKETAIPLGRYRIDITKSTRFGVMMPLLWNVETKDGRRFVRSADGLLSFEGIRVHWGNNAAHTDGCLLTGRQRGINEVQQSRVAYDAFVAKLEIRLKAGPAFIDVRLAADGERAIS